MKKILTTILAAALAGGVWGDGDVLPRADVSVKNAAELAEMMGADEEAANALLSDLGRDIVLRATKGDQGIELKSVAYTTSTKNAFVFEPLDTDGDTMEKYGDWYCDYVVSFDEDVAADSIILTGFYNKMLASILMGFPFEGNNKTKQFLISSVGYNYTYDDIVKKVGKFICTAINVSRENIGKTINVSLVMWRQEENKETDCKVVTTIPYTFTEENLSTIKLPIDLTGSGSTTMIPFQLTSNGYDAFGMAFDQFDDLAQKPEGPHFTPVYSTDIGEADAQTGNVTAEVQLETQSGDVTIATAVVSIDPVTTKNGDAGTKIDADSIVKVESVVRLAAASGLLEFADNTIEIQLQVSESSVAGDAVTYDVTPIAIINGDSNHAVDLSNDDLAANASFTFNLDVTGIADVGGKVKVVHTSSETAKYPDETFTVTAVAGGNGAVVPITTSHFSTFTLSAAAAEPAVNTVVSANEFGALAITGNAAKPAYVAVPFGAFGDGDASIAAADVVQAKVLSEGDKMYVWNGAEGTQQKTQQKYEVYTVSGGAWTTANKVTVAADGTVTTDSTPADALPVASGKGVFIERKDTAKPLYVYGQVLTNTVAETTFEPGLTLVSAPSLKAMGEIDLNTLTWTNVTALESSTVTVKGTEYVTPKWSKIATADYLYYRTPTGATVRCYYCGGKWITENNKTPGKIPAGTAFWYYARGTEAKVVW